jgi:hypothetical protein
VLTYEDVINKLSSPNLSAKKRFLCCIHYAGALRVSESRKFNLAELKKRNPNIKSLIEFETPDAIFLNFPNSKNRKRNIKVLPILKKELWLYKPIMYFLNEISSEGISIPDRTARSIIKDVFGVPSHQLRHSRLTHLITLFKFDCLSKKFCDYAGWSNNAPSSVYIVFSQKEISQSIADDMVKNFNNNEVKPNV